MVIGIIIVICIGAFVYWQTQSSRASQTASTNLQETATAQQSINPQETANSTTTNSATNPMPASNTNSTSTSSETITAAQIAQHKDATSCWTSINGNVYDLTKWIPQHPGGPQAILQLCGTDGSAKFNKQHGGMARQAAVLAGFKIGVLAE